MTNNEAAKWIQIYIDEWNKDLNQMKGFGMRLNEKGKKMMKAIEMGRDALKRTDECTESALKAQETCNDLATNLQPSKQDADDTISRQAAIDAEGDKWN